MVYRRVPYRRRQRRYRRRVRRKPWNRKPRLGRPSRGLKQSVYLVKRSFTNVVNLRDPNPEGTTHPGVTWTSVDDTGMTPAGITDGTAMRVNLALTDLPDNSEFTSGLFSQFKISGVAVEIIPCFTQSGTGAYPVQALAYIMPPNQSLMQQSTAELQALSEAKCLQTQACKKKRVFIQGKNFKYYFPCKEVGVTAKELLPGSFAPVGSFVKPRWHGFSNDELATKHYSTSIRFQPINRGSWGTETNQIKVIYTVYLALRGIV